MNPDDKAITPNRFAPRNKAQNVPTLLRAYESVTVDVFADIAEAHLELVIEIEESNLEPLRQKRT